MLSYTDKKKNVLDWIFFILAHNKNIVKYKKLP